MFEEQDIFQMLYDNRISGEEALQYLERMNVEEHAEKKQDFSRDGKEKVSDDQSGCSVGMIKVEIESIIRGILHVDEEFYEDVTFKEIGVDSITAVEIIRNINQKFGLNMDMVVIYDYPSIAELSTYVFDLYQKTGNRLSSANVKTKSALDERTVEGKLKETVSRILHIQDSELDEMLSFRELGVDSISGIEIIREMNKVFQINMDSVDIYDYPTISEMTQHIVKLVGTVAQEKVDYEESKTKVVEKDVYHDEHYLEMRQRYIQRTDTQYDYNEEKEENVGPKITLKSLGKKKIEQSSEKKVVLSNLGKISALPTKEAVSQVQRVQATQSDCPKTNIGVPNMKESDEYRKIAIIGMSGKFPNAKNLDQYWENIRDGKDCVSEIPKSRWNHELYFDEEPKTPGKTNTRWMGVVPDIDQFDPLFFNISPLEAETMDPQQRLFLMEAWKALEDAGYPRKKLNGLTCGVFVGTSQSDYLKIIEGGEVANPTDVFTGLSPSILASRISYFLNLNGPSVSLDTACSSSLVAIHEACRSIQAGDSSLAIAGGVRLIMTPDLLIQSTNAGIMSPTGKCRAFSQDADGIVLGDGVGAIVLKDYEKAKEDHDHIYGVIRASGVNQDGRTNGITAPSAQSQTRLEQKVLKQANVNPEEITLVETHGTGTKLGDPIEVSALKETFGKYTQKKNYCALSSVKANIGHVSMAAGVAGVIKVLLAMKNKMIPPQIHVNQINEHIDLDNSPFYINRELKEWKTEGNQPRIATVSSFGFSGTNCYIVLEEV